MKDNFHLSMTWLHTWSGLVVGWVLFFIFVTGTAGYFYMEIDRWMRPEQPLQSKTVAADVAVAMAEKHLQSRAAGADSWTINIPGARETPYLNVSWRNPPKPGEEPNQGRGGGGRFGGPSDILDTQTGEVQPSKPRETGGGLLLYRMHWALHYMPYEAAAWIVGICTMFMFVAIITGVIIIYKKIFREFFTFRKGKGARSWMDMHTVISVTSLPFFIMITFSGLLFYLYTYMPLAPKILFGDEGAQRERRFFGDQGKRDGNAAPLFSLVEALKLGEQEFGKNQVRNINVQFPGDSAAIITITPKYDRYLNEYPQLKVNGTTGAVLDNPPRKVSAVEKTNNVILAIHEGVFANTLIRWLYFLAGVLGCAMIATGLVLWTVKRRPKAMKNGKFSFGHNLVERLNIGTVAGLPGAVAIYFLANRLIPVDLAGRREWEVHAMFIGWLLLLIYPAFRSIKRGWIEVFLMTAALYLLLPVVNFFTTERHLGISLLYGDWVLAGIDITFLALGCTCVYIAMKIKRHPSAITKAVKTKKADDDLTPVTNEVLSS